jgi:high-affinity K+ transport system ATPase subunit B
MRSRKVSPGFDVMRTVISSLNTRVPPVTADRSPPAMLSAIIFNALIIILLVPLGLRGVKYRPSSAAAMLQRNLLVYGLGGVVVPFIVIKAHRYGHHCGRSCLEERSP